MSIMKSLRERLAALLRLPQRTRVSDRRGLRAAPLAIDWLEDRLAPSAGGTTSFPPVPGGPQVGFPSTSAQETFEWYFINVLRQNPQAALDYLKTLYHEGQGQNSSAPLYARLIWDQGQQNGGDSWLTANQNWLNQWVAQSSTDGIPSTRAPLVMSTYMVQQTEALAQFFIDHKVYGHTPDLLAAFPGADGAPIRNQHFSDQYQLGGGGFLYPGAYAEDIGSGPSGLSLTQDSNWRSTVMGWFDVANFMLDWGNPQSAGDPFGFGHLGNLLSRDPADGYIAQRDVTGQMPFNQIGVGVVPLYGTTVGATDIHDGGIPRELDQFTVAHQLIYRQGNPYVTGIVFADRPIRDDTGTVVAPADGYYEPGEGLYARITAVNTATGAKYQTLEMADQGYALQVPAGNYRLTTEVIPVIGLATGVLGGFGVAIGDPVQVESTNITVGNVNVWHPIMLGQSLGLALTGSSGLSAVTDDGMNDGSTSAATRLGNATRANPLSGTTPVLTINSPTDVDWYTFGLTGRATSKDYFSIYFDNARGDLDLGLYDAQGNLLRSSTSTNNFETINLGGLGSGVYYLKVYGYHGATNFYTAQYALAPTAAGPVFNHPNQGPFTIAEGQDLNLDLSATDPDGGGLFYSLAGNPPAGANINLTGGQFSWEPAPGTAGHTYTFTAVADNTQLTSKLTFQVTVVSGAPNIASASATPDSISDTGTDTITVTAHDVTTGVGAIAQVEFYLDLVGNGALDTTKDRFLGYGKGVAGTNDSTWTGALLGVSPGTVNVLIRAVRFSFSNVFYSPTAVVPVLVKHVPPLPPIAVPNGPEQAAIADNGGPQQGSAIMADPVSGDLYVIWNRGTWVGTPTAGHYTYTAMLSTFNARGQALGAPVALTTGFGYGISAAVMTDGTHFDAVLWGSDGYHLGRFTTAGAFLEVAAMPTPARRASLAADGSGNIVVAWDQGGYLSEQVLARQFGPDLSPKAGAFRVDSLPVGNSGSGPAARDPVVQCAPDGGFVIVWSELVFPSSGPSISRLVGHRFTAAGQSIGSDFTITTDLATDLPANVAMNGNGEWIATWTPGSQAAILARRFNGGTPIDGQPIRVNTTVDPEDLYPEVVLSDGGWFAVTWAGYGQDPGDLSFDAGGYAQLFDKAGNKAGPEFRVADTTTGSQTPAGILTAPNRALDILWNSGPTQSNDVTPYLRTYQVNFPPQLDPIAPLITLYGSPVKFTAAATDADYPAETVTYSLQGKVPAGARIDPVTGAFSWVPTLAQAGQVYDFFVQAQDNGTPVRSSTAAVQIDVRKAGHAPTIAPITAAPIAYTDRGAVTVPFQALDADNDPITVTATALAHVAVASKPAGIAVPVTVTAGQLQIDLSGLPATDLLRQVVVTLAAADWHGRVSTTFTILAKNFAPVIDPYSPQKVQHDSGAVTLPLQGRDADGDPLTYSASLYAVAPAVPFRGAAATVSFNRQAGTLSILPAAGFAGTFGVRLTASDGTSQVTTAFGVSVLNAPSTLVVSNHEMSARAGSMAIPLQTINPDNDPQTFTASAVVFSPAYELRRQYGLQTPAGGYATNSHGAGEKNLVGSGGQRYFILADGSVYRWTGAVVTSVLVGQLDPSYYADPTLLTKAQAVAATPVSTSISGATLTLAPPAGFSGYVRVTATVSDGVSHDTRSFTVRVGDLAPVFPTIPPQAMTLAGGPRTIALGAADPEGTAVTYAARVVDPGYVLEHQLGLTVPVAGYPTNLHGAQEKYLRGAGGQLFFILPTGQFYLWGGSLAGSRLIAVLNSAYYNDLTLITKAVNPTSLPVTVTVDDNTGTLTIDPHGYAGRFYVQVAASDDSLSTVQTFGVIVTAG
jgi:hypothetical protein